MEENKKRKWNNEKLSVIFEDGVETGEISNETIKDYCVLKTEIAMKSIKDMLNEIKEDDFKKFLDDFLKTQDLSSTDRKNYQNKGMALYYVFINQNIELHEIFDFSFDLSFIDNKFSITHSILLSDEFIDMITAITR